VSRKQIGLAAGIVAVIVILAGLGYHFFVASRGGAAGPASGTAPARPAATAQSAPGELPNPSILVIDRSAIMQYSKVGQDIARQVQAYAEQARKDLAARNQSVEAEGQQLQQQADTLAPDVRQKRIAAFEANQRALRDAADQKDDQIKQALAAANGAVSQAVGPILADIAKEHGANMIIDKQAVTFALDPSFDVTQEVISRLNDKLSSYKVTLAAK